MLEQARRVLAAAAEGVQEAARIAARTGEGRAIVRGFAGVAQPTSAARAGGGSLS